MIRYLSPPEDPSGLALEVRRRMREELGVVAEPLSLHAAVPTLMAASWCTFRETMIAEGRLGREIKEVIGIAVSRTNRCPYCVESHRLFLQSLGSGTKERVLARMRSDDNSRHLPWTAWAEGTCRKGSPSLLASPFGPEEAPVAVATALCFHYINRMVTPLLGESPIPILPNLLRRPLLWFAVRALRTRGRRPHTPGTSLSLLPEVDVPLHLRWADSLPTIQRAFARLAAAVEEATDGVLEEETRRTLRRRLDLWQGEDMPFGDGWMTHVTTPLSRNQAAAARLALLGALAPHRIDEGEVAAFRAHHPYDAALVGTLAWGAFGATRRVSEWVTPGT